MQARISHIARVFPRRVADALKIEAEIEMTEMKKRTPVQFGVLRDSGTVHEPVQSRSGVSIVLSFGGAAQDYALKVHEDLDAFHKVGQAKYAESVLLESAPHMAKRIAARVQLGSMV
jgi:hypothetical protein